MRPQSHPDLPFDAGHPPKFDGESFVKAKDEARLTGQLLRTFDLLKDGQWITLSELAARIGCSEAAASARLRDLRKKRCGAHTVERQRLDSGLHRYRLIVSRRLPLAT